MTSATDPHTRPQRGGRYRQDAPFTFRGGLPLGRFRINRHRQRMHRRDGGAGPRGAAAGRGDRNRARGQVPRAEPRLSRGRSRRADRLASTRISTSRREALASLLAPLQDSTAQAACGQMDVETSGVAPAVRIFYEGWRANPYFSQGKFGGLFALSPDGAARVFPLPDITADDEYIRRSFAPPTKSPSCPDAASSRGGARAPRTLASLLHVRRRSLRGARDVARMGKASPERGSARAMLRRAVVSPAESASGRLFPVALGLGAPVSFCSTAARLAGNATPRPA